MQFPELWTDNCADLLRAFNNQGVQYLLIGSMAKSPNPRGRMLQIPSNTARI